MTGPQKPVTISTMTIFFSSDNHFGHENILTFVNDVSKIRIRGMFSTVEEMNEHMIEKHNSVVGPTDKWYCLGDVGFGMKGLREILPRLNGRKRLILGNHDYSERKDFAVYFEHFEKVMESRRMGPLLFTHRPVYLGQHESHILGNVHGHIHEKVLPDKRYMNVSVENIGYVPVSLEEIKEMYTYRGIDVSEA